MAKEESTEPTKEEKLRANAIKSLDGKSQLWNYALPLFATSEQYGQLSHLVKMGYKDLIGKTPSQEIYEQLYLPALSHDGGTVSSPYLQETSAAILQESIHNLKVSDVQNVFGSSVEIQEAYKDKYVSELPQEIAQKIIGSYITYVVQDKMKGVLESSRKGVKQGLEDILTGKKESH